MRLSSTNFYLQTPSENLTFHIAHQYFTNAVHLPTADASDSVDCWHGVPYMCLYDLYNKT